MTKGERAGQDRWIVNVVKAIGDNLAAWSFWYAFVEDWESPRARPTDPIRPDTSLKKSLRPLIYTQN